MKKTQRLRYEMFVRISNFGTANVDVFPESGPAGQKFAQLASVVASIESHLVRRARARTDARKLKAATRRATLDFMRAIVATGRQAADEERDPHPFRMPERKATAVVLTTARLFLEEAGRRQEKFVELGMAPTFLEEFAAVTGEFQAAVGLQQNSRGARRKAQAGIDTGLARGRKLIAQLDVTVANALRTDAARLAQWQGARHVDRRSASSVASTPAPADAGTDAPPSDPSKEVLRIAS